ARESQFRESWHSRNCRILDRLLHLKSSEFWVDNEELAGMYESRLHDEGYLTYKLARTNSRGDGLLTALHQSQFRLLNYRELLFNDIADRVAQVLHVELCCDNTQKNTTNIVKEAIIVNTHLIFPHNSRYCFLRLQQVYKILQYIRSYMGKYALHIPVILCGDWNGSKKGHVYKFLRSQGFVSTYDIAHHHEDDTDDSQKWVSHRNHRGNICGVDFIWLQNPQKYQKPLKESFMEAILGNIKNLLHKVITGGVDQLPLRLRGSCITYSDFSQALVELGISGNPDGGLNDEDIRDIWKCIDEDGDGIVHVPNVLRAWTLCALQHDDSSGVDEVEDARNSTAAIGFTVNKATLFPQEVEEGTWPENYLLSDHAHLTVEFAVM
uniref:EF-hand domain-containing protein n=1 Tax=Chenopodium quinoa TaxID=63459 RepID=A0A803KR75_CHEQI